MMDIGAVVCPAEIPSLMAKGVIGRMKAHVDLRVRQGINAATREVDEIGRDDIVSAITRITEGLLVDASPSGSE